MNKIFIPFLVLFSVTVHAQIEILIIDIQGREVLRLQSYEIQLGIDISNFTNGMFYVNIKSENFNFVKSFIKAQ